MFPLIHLCILTPEFYLYQAATKVFPHKNQLGEEFMSIAKIIQSITDGTTQVFTYILGAAKRIFSPRDDNYPETGVQPFKGDISEDKRRH